MIQSGDQAMMRHRSAVLILALTLVATVWVPSAAQESSTDPEQLRDRIRNRIRTADGMDDALRLRMENHLERCLRLGLTDDQVEGLFPMAGPGNGMTAAHMLRMQERILAGAESGLAVDLLAGKMREGRMKGASPDAIEGAMARMEEHLRFAHRVMRRSVEEGVTTSGNEETERHLQRGMALNMWRGLHEGDLEHLREQARLRARDGSCSTTELAAAAETTTSLIEQGLDRQRSREMLGLGLRQGYTAEEMRRMATMAQAGPPEEVLAWLDEHIRQGMGLEQMMQRMMRRGWMGPGDIHGHGGHSPVDDVIGGPWRHGGGQQQMGGDGSSGQGHASGSGHGG
jgi:hypothetical protein